MADKAKSLRTPRARLSFPHLFTPRANDQGVEKYSVSLVFDRAAQQTAEFKALVAASREALAGKFGTKAVLGQGYKSPFRQGSEKAHLGAPYDEPGAVFVGATSMRRVQCFDQACTPIMNHEELYPGCYVYASVVLFAYDKAGNKGVSFGLRGIQKVADGEPLVSNAADDFEALPDAGGSEATPRQSYQRPAAQGSQTPDPVADEDVPF